MDYLICGKHTVCSACSNKRAKVVYLSESSSKNAKFPDSIKIEIKNKAFFKKNFENFNLSHQGYAALVKPILKYNLNDIISPQRVKLVALQGIEDQRNIGSIIRSCAAFNVDCLLIEKKSFNESSLLMNKSHAGNIEHLKIITTTNIINQIKTLKKKDFTIYCLDQNSNQNIKEIKFEDKSLILFGSESKGLKQYIKDECHHNISIKINKNVESLNLSNAVSVTLSHL